MIRTRRAFSFVELMIVVAIIGILAAIAAPRYLGLGEESGEAALRQQLDLVRGQIEVYRWKEGADPTLLANQWTTLVDGQYISSSPMNPLNGFDTVSGSAGANIGWVYRDRGDGVYELLATDRNPAAIFPE